MTETVQPMTPAASTGKLSLEAIAALKVKLEAIQRKADQNPRPAIQWRGVADETYFAALAWLDEHG